LRRSTSRKAKIERGWKKSKIPRMIEENPPYAHRFAVEDTTHHAFALLLLDRFSASWKTHTRSLRCCRARTCSSSKSKGGETEATTMIESSGL
jgi:hypothetical protein